MFNLVHVEIKKLMSSKILWLILAGAILPAVISALTLLNVDGVYWKGYIHTSMDTFNSLAFLVFASFVSFIWAREYEEKMMEITLLYPYPKYMLLFAKMLLMVLIIFITVALWFAGTCVTGRFLLGSMISAKDLKELLQMLLPIMLMHFLLITFTFFFTIVLKNILVGTIFGVVEVSLCYLFKGGSAIQYIPLCVPLVISDNMYGFKKIILDSYAVSWGILIATFAVMLAASIVFIQKKWELR